MSRRISKTGVGLLLAASMVLTACPKPQLQITLSPGDVAIRSGETAVVTARVTRNGDPEANVTVTFATGDENVATVSPSSAATDADGVVQATVQGESEGSTTLTATADDRSASSDVTVSGRCSTHMVTLQGIAFNPDALTIRACDTVTWQHNDGGVRHTVTSGNVGDADAGAIFDSRGGDPDARMTQGDTFSHTFDDTGTFPYHCVVHGGQGMTGSVTVNPNP